MPSEAHLGLVCRVNQATTHREHELADAELRGYRRGLREMGCEPDLAGCDLYYLDLGIDRPMCCGVWLDWKPAVNGAERMCRKEG